MFTGLISLLLGRESYGSVPCAQWQVLCSGLSVALWAMAAAGQSAGAPAGMYELRKGESRVGFEPGQGGGVTELELRTTGFTFSLPAGGLLGRPVFTRQAMEGTPPALEFPAPAGMAGAAPVSACRFEILLTQSNSDEAVSGLQFRHDVRLAEDGRRLEFIAILSNVSAEVCGAQFGIKHSFDLDSVKGQSTLYLPTERSIQRIINETVDRFYSRVSAWDYQPVEGWLAMINERSGMGVVFILDQSVLDSFYAKPAQGICGWFWDGGILQPQGFFSTTWWLAPVTGFVGMVHASRRLLADVQVKNTGAGVELTHFLAGMEKPLGEVTVKTAIYGVRSKKTVDLAPVSLAAVGLDPACGKTIMEQPQTEPLVIRVEAGGKGWNEKYETYWEGEFRNTAYPGYPYEPEYRRPKIKK